MLPPSPPTDPDVQNYCIRFFAGELRGQTEDERAPNYRAPRHHAWPSLAESPVRLSIVVTWTRLWAQSPLACFPAMGLSHEFSPVAATSMLRFTRGVAAHVQGSLPAGGLRLCREGFEPSGPLRKVSVRFDDHPPFLLS